MTLPKNQIITTLKRVLGPFSLTALGIGAVIGAGIFVLTGLAAKEYAGPSLILSFVLSGLACIFVALCYAEFASMVPPCRQCLHLFLCSAGRGFRVDYWVGSYLRVFPCIEPCGSGVVALLCKINRTLWLTYPTVAYQ